jgi:hypothetical protein
MYDLISCRNDDNTRGSSSLPFLVGVPFKRGQSRSQQRVVLYPYSFPTFNLHLQPFSPDGERAFRRKVDLKRRARRARQGTTQSLPLDAASA